MTTDTKTLLRAAVHRILDVEDPHLQLVMAAGQLAEAARHDICSASLEITASLHYDELRAHEDEMDRESTHAAREVRTLLCGVLEEVRCEPTSPETPAAAREGPGR